MPLVVVNYDPRAVTDVELRHLGALLAGVVPEAVECPEEPHTGPLTPGDMNIFFRPTGPLDMTELDCIVEVRTELFSSGIANKDERAAPIKSRVADCLAERCVGVWIILLEGAWARRRRADETIRSRPPPASRRS